MLNCNIGSTITSVDEQKKLFVDTFFHAKRTYHRPYATIMSTKTQLKADDNMSHKGIIQDNLTKSDPNLEINQVIEERAVYRVIGKLTYRLTVCAYCYTRNMVKNGFKTVYIRDIPFNNKPIILQIAKQRFLCKACHRSTIAQTKLVKKHAQLTQRLKFSLINYLVQDLAVDHVAQKLNVSPVSVNRIVTELHEQWIHPQAALPTHLSFDEVRTTQHQMSFLAINAENGDLVTLLPDRLAKNIISHFERRYSLAVRQAVKSVVLDFNSSYHTFVKRLFPNAKIIADRFHLIQMLNRVINQTRISVMHQFNWHSRQYRLLKYYWKLYLKPFEQLETKRPFWRKHLKDRLTAAQIVAQGINIAPEFAQVYEVAQALAAAIRNHHPAKLIKLLKTKTQNLALNTLLKTFNIRVKAITNALHSPLSNGRIEGIIRKIKQIKRTAYGYRNWQHFRDRILIEFSFKTKKRKPIRR